MYVRAQISHKTYCIMLILTVKTSDTHVHIVHQCAICNNHSTDEATKPQMYSTANRQRHTRSPVKY